MSLEQFLGNNARWYSNPAHGGALDQAYRDSTSKMLSPTPLKYVVIVNTEYHDKAIKFQQLVQQGRAYISEDKVHKVSIEDFKLTGSNGSVYIFQSNSTRLPQFVQQLILDTALECGVIALPLKTFSH